MSRLRRLVRGREVALGTWVVLLGGWEIVAHLAPKGQLRGSPVVPSLEFIWTTAFKSLSGSWAFHMWAPEPAYGGRETYRGALLAAGYNSLETFMRVLLGLGAGLVVGVGAGLIISYSSIARRIIWGPLNFLRMVPLLAAIPLFAFWFGPNSVGTTVFIGFGDTVMLVVATINAVRNVPNHYSESARTLGASRLQTYGRVVVPRALPELRTALLLAAGLSWSLAVGSEYLGLQNGLGSIMATAANTANTGRMIIVALLIMFCALTTFFVLNRVFLRMVHWVPRAAATSGVALGTGIASAAGGRAIAADSVS